MPLPAVASPAHNRTLLRDVVRDQLVRVIMDGTLEPGEILRDDELQEWLGVSRTPLRDAINELTRAGLIEMAPNRYTRVALPTGDDALHALHTLGTLLGGVVRLAVPRLTDEQQRIIDADIDEAMGSLDGGEVKIMSRHFLELFNQYVASCANPLLTQLCHDSLDGLAFKLRVGNLLDIIDIDAARRALEDLRTATMQRDPIGAELATESLHMLPGRRPL
jgi:DNA-binding GntR family transcriptional regulator